MNWMTKRKILGVSLSIALVVALITTSVVTLADHINKENNQTIGDTVEVQNYLNQTIPESMIDEENISIDMIEQQLEGTPLVTLENSDEVVEYLDYETEDLLTGEGEFVSKVDNSDSKYFPPIGNQGSMATCTVWATVYYQMSYTLNKQLDRDGKLDENIMSPYWVYSMINNGIDDGAYYSDALKVLSEIGAVSIKHVPCEGDMEEILYSIKAKKSNWLAARKNKVQEYYNVNIGENDKTTPVTCPSSESLESIKSALLCGEVLTATSHATSWVRDVIKENEQVSENSKYAGEVIVSSCNNSSASAHRITIVGFNDGLWVDINKDGLVQEGEKGAFKIADSYGEERDNNGFVWMSYDAVNKLSSVDSNPNYQVNVETRRGGLSNIIGFSVDVNSEDNNAFVELKFSSDDAKSIQVYIKAQNKESKEIYEYAPIPFSNSNLLQNVGDNSFDVNSYERNKGVFCIDLSNVIDGITPDKIDDYNWEISVMDSTEDESVIKVLKAQFLNAKDNSYMTTNLTQPIELESTNVLITRGRDIDSDNKIEVNAAVYSFEVTDKEKYTFSTPSEFADNRYYDIYILDKEYTGKLSEISKKYSVSKSTRGGTTSVKIKKGKYVYCVAKNKSAWKGFVYRNKAKLTVTID